MTQRRKASRPLGMHPLLAKRPWRRPRFVHLPEILDGWTSTAGGALGTDSDQHASVMAVGVASAFGTQEPIDGWVSTVGAGQRIVGDSGDLANGRYRF